MHHDPIEVVTIAPRTPLSFTSRTVPIPCAEGSKGARRRPLTLAVVQALAVAVVAAGFELIELHRRMRGMSVLELARHYDLHVELSDGAAPGGWLLMPRGRLVVLGLGARSIDSRAARRAALHAVVCMLAAKHVGLDVADVDQAAAWRCVDAIRRQIGLPGRPRAYERAWWFEWTAVRLAMDADFASEHAMAKPAASAERTSSWSADRKRLAPSACR